MNIDLEYPLDIDKILRKKKSIKKALLSNKNLVEKNIAILGGSTTSEIKKILELFLLDSGVKPNFYESEYNKYYEDALFGNDVLDKFNPDIVYIHTTNQNIIKYPELDNNLEELLSTTPPIFPLIISYASVQLKTNFPEVIST